MSHFQRLVFSRNLISRVSPSRSSVFPSKCHCKYRLPQHGPSNIRVLHQKSSWPRIEWFYIPASVGFGVIMFVQLKHMWKRKNKKEVEYNDPSFNQGYILTQWQVDLLKYLPTRAFSRFWGYICCLHIPGLLLKPLLNGYSLMFDCNLDEALVSDLTRYKTFNEFFTRKLKSNAREVHPSATLVSPADATVVTFGSLSYSNLALDQVKGLTYPLNVFVGPRHPFMKGLHSCFNDDDKVFSPGSCPSTIEKSEDHKIFYISMYLGPGDYHWFHSPTEWSVEHRRHIPGHLFSVNPRVLRSINGIFNFNERVILSGHWQHGLFMYAAIGAYNVGSIKLNNRWEKDLQTNYHYQEDQKYKDRLYGTGITYKRGDSLGGFELGSSLVLVFTAPKDFTFNIEAGQKLKYGEQIGNTTIQEEPLG